MKFGHYEVDVHDCNNRIPKVKYIGRGIMSHQHKRARDRGREVWEYTGEWRQSLFFGQYVLKDKPKIIQMMELTGSL